MALQTLPSASALKVEGLGEVWTRARATTRTTRLLPAGCHWHDSGWGLCQVLPWSALGPAHGHSCASLLTRHEWRSKRHHPRASFQLRFQAWLHLAPRSLSPNHVKGWTPLAGRRSVLGGRRGYTFERGGRLGPSIILKSCWDCAQDAHRRIILKSSLATAARPGAWGPGPDAV